MRIFPILRAGPSTTLSALLTFRFFFASYFSACLRLCAMQFILLHFAFLLRAPVMNSERSITFTAALPPRIAAFYFSFATSLRLRLCARRHFNCISCEPACHTQALARQAGFGPARTYRRIHLDINDLAFGTGGPWRDASISDTMPMKPLPVTHDLRA